MNKNYQFQGCWMKGNDIDYGVEDRGYYQDHRNVVLVKAVSLHFHTISFFRHLLSAKTFYS